MTVLVLRPSPSGEALVSLLHLYGVEAYHTPLIKFAPGRELDLLPDKLARLRRGDLLFAVSKQAVNYADAALSKNKIGWPKDIHYFAVGRTTAAALSAATDCRVSYPKDREISEHLLQLTELQNIKDKNALILRGNGGRELLAGELSLRGAKVEFCECYQRQNIDYSSEELIAVWLDRKIETIIVTSTEMLQKLYALIDVHEKPDNRRLFDCRLIVVSERIALLARELGWSKIKIADNADNRSLLAAFK